MTKHTGPFAAGTTTASQGACDHAEIDAGTLYDMAAAESVFNDRSMEQGTFMVESPSRLRVLSKFTREEAMTEIPMGMIIPPAPEESSDSENREGTDDTFATASELRIFPALVGTMTHRLMEMLVSAKNKVDVHNAVVDIIREYRTAESEPYESIFSRNLLRVADTIRSGGYPQTNGLPQDILSTLLSADEVYCEVPFCYKEEAQEVPVIWNGIMDAVYCTDGQWHIIDYKTNAEGTNLDGKYRGQLTAYIKAFKQITGNDADAKTYHIDI